MMENQIRIYFEKKNEVTAVFLFGSYAKGKPERFSDVDMAILFGISDRDIAYNRLEKYHVVLSRLLRKDIHFVTLNFAGEMLILQVFRSGKCILINDQNKLSDFKIVAFSRIFDFNYHRNKMETGLIRRLMHGRS